MEEHSARFNQIKILYDEVHNWQKQDKLDIDIFARNVMLQIVELNDQYQERGIIELSYSELRQVQDFLFAIVDNHKISKEIRRKLMCENAILNEMINKTKFTKDSFVVLQ